MAYLQRTLLVCRLRLFVARGALVKTSRRWQQTAASAILQEEIDQANQRQDLVEIQRTQDGRGWGIFAKQDLDMGDLVLSAQALQTLSRQGSHTIQTGWKTHVYMDLPARFLNHVCGQATVGLRSNAKGAYDFVAIAPIPQGDEVVWDYECSEFELDDFACACGLPTCRGKLRGFQHHGPMVVNDYGKECIAPYLFTPKSVCRNPFE
jgi:hypothetical protein